MKHSALSLNGVSCTRGGVLVLAEVTFDVSVGEVLIITGPNGAGKTTLLRSIAGLQPIASGKIAVDANDIAYAGHADGIKGSLTVTENLRFWAGLHGTHDVDTAIATMDLSHLKDRPAQTLSAGQKRRLGLARLLITGAGVWILDEPTVSLDAASVAIFGAALREHLTQGGAAVIATHIDLGIDVTSLDISRFKPKSATVAAFDEAFL